MTRARGAGLCLRILCAEAAPALGRHAHPEVLRHGVALCGYLRPSEADGWDEAARPPARSTRGRPGAMA